MDIIVISPTTSEYPASVLEHLGANTPPPIAALGNIQLLRGAQLALFCSIRCPGQPILLTYEIIRALRDAGIAVIGGFHSPMEKECLALLLRGTQPVVICPARGLDGMRIPKSWQKPLADGRLLVVSALETRSRRTTAETAERRNQFVAALASRVLVPHAGSGSKTEQLCRQLLRSGKTVWTLDHADNTEPVALGARVIRAEDVHELPGASPTSSTNPGT
jgi:predicted Rossmann fold nucleotide-binding protein DprA/Smf involved in DNA uptake